MLLVLVNFSVVFWYNRHVNETQEIKQMISLLIAILVLWLVAKYVPYGDKIVAVVVGLWLLRFFGFIWF